MMEVMETSEELDEAKAQEQARGAVEFKDLGTMVLEVWGVRVSSSSGC